MILPKKLSETDISTMLEFVIDNVFAMFDGRAFQQKIVILRRLNTGTSHE